MIRYLSVTYSHHNTPGGDENHPRSVRKQSFAGNLSDSPDLCCLTGFLYPALQNSRREFLKIVLLPERSMLPGRSGIDAADYRQFTDLLKECLFEWKQNALIVFCIFAAHLQE